MTLGRLDSRVTLVTGAASGIGRGIAEEYASEGAVVVMLDLNEEGLAQARQETEAKGGIVRHFRVDVTDYDRMREVRDAVVEEFGRLDVMVNNAGIVLSGDVVDTSLEDWRRVMAVDLEAVYIGSKLAAEVMMRQKAGRIISIASIQAFMTTGHVGSYNAAKAGVVGLTRSLAVELGPHGILVNAIAPGAIRTGMSRKADGSDSHDDGDFQERYIRSGRIPLGREGLPRDIAGAALFLASDDCRYMTGALLVVDGGLSLTI